jgi:hypothetical protein
MYILYCDFRKQFTVDQFLLGGNVQSVQFTTCTTTGRMMYRHVLCNYPVHCVRSNATKQKENEIHKKNSKKIFSNDSLVFKGDLASINQADIEFQFSFFSLLLSFMLTHCEPQGPAMLLQS